MTSRRSTQSVTQRSTRQSELHKARRPRRLVTPKVVDDSVGLSRKEERELRRALYASLHESRRPRTPQLEEESLTGEGVPKLRKSTRHVVSPQAFQAGGRDRGQASNGNNLDDSSQDSVMSSVGSSHEHKKKIHAQRKFAQGCSLPSTPGGSPGKKQANSPHSLLNRVPKTEDFLTFLCLRGSRLLPPNLDYFNFARDESSLEDGNSRPRTPVPGEQSEQTRESTPESSTSGSNVNEELMEITTPVSTPFRLLQATQKAARASAGTPETARGIVSLRQGLTRKLSNVARSTRSSQKRKKMDASQCEYVTSDSHRVRNNNEAKDVAGTQQEPKSEKTDGLGRNISSSMDFLSSYKIFLKECGEKDAHSETDSEEIFKKPAVPKQHSGKKRKSTEATTDGVFKIPAVPRASKRRRSSETSSGDDFKQPAAPEWLGVQVRTRSPLNVSHPFTNKSASTKLPDTETRSTKSGRGKKFPNTAERSYDPKSIRLPEQKADHLQGENSDQTGSESESASEEALVKPAERCDIHNRILSEQETGYQENDAVDQTDSVSDISKVLRNTAESARPNRIQPEQETVHLKNDTIDQTYSVSPTCSKVFSESCNTEETAAATALPRAASVISDNISGGFRTVIVSQTKGTISIKEENGRSRTVKVEDHHPPHHSVHGNRISGVKEERETEIVTAGKSEVCKTEDKTENQKNFDKKVHEESKKLVKYAHAKTMPLKKRHNRSVSHSQLKKTLKKVLDVSNTLNEQASAKKPGKALKMQQTFDKLKQNVAEMSAKVRDFKRAPVSSQQTRKALCEGCGAVDYAELYKASKSKAGPCEEDSRITTVCANITRDHEFLHCPHRVCDIGSLIGAMSALSFANSEHTNGEETEDSSHKSTVKETKDTNLKSTEGDMHSDHQLHSSASSHCAHSEHEENKTHLPTDVVTEASAGVSDSTSSCMGELYESQTVPVVIASDESRDTGSSHKKDADISGMEADVDYAHYSADGKTEADYDSPDIKRPHCSVLDCRPQEQASTLVNLPQGKSDCVAPNLNGDRAIARKSQTFPSNSYHTFRQQADIANDTSCRETARISADGDNRGSTSVPKSSYNVYSIDQKVAYSCMCGKCRVDFTCTTNENSKGCERKTDSVTGCRTGLLTEKENQSLKSHPGADKTLAVGTVISDKQPVLECRRESKNGALQTETDSSENQTAAVVDKDDHFDHLPNTKNRPVLGAVNTHNLVSADILSQQLAHSELLSSNNIQKSPTKRIRNLRQGDACGPMNRTFSSDQAFDLRKQDAKQVQSLIQDCSLSTQNSASQLQPLKFDAQDTSHTATPTLQSSSLSMKSVPNKGGVKGGVNPSHTATPTFQSPSLSMKSVSIKGGVNPSHTATPTLQSSSLSMKSVSNKGGVKGGVNPSHTVTPTFQSSSLSMKSVSNKGGVKGGVNPSHTATPTFQCPSLSMKSVSNKGRVNPHAVGPAFQNSEGGGGEWIPSAGGSDGSEVFRRPVLYPQPPALFSVPNLCIPQESAHRHLQARGARQAQGKEGGEAL